MTDYIIVGAGSAGCILANRLSADPSAQVTLLEAGGSDRHIFYRMPAGFLGLMKTGMGDWGYECVPQPGLNGRTMHFPRGKVLGGSSSINGQVIVRGNAGDFDGWAQSGATGWSYEDCLPYFRKFERHPGGDTDLRGGSGPIGITVAPPAEQMTPMGQAWFKAAEQAGYPINPDLNGSTQEGFGRADANFSGTRRQSTSATYLAEAIGRPNLRVISQAQATRILFRNSRAIGVEYASNGKRRTIETDGEVILAGGTVNSPQLLQLSGVGPAELLRRHGIAVVQELAGVGENLQDHICQMVKQEMTKPYSALAYTRPLKAAISLAQYALFKSGPTLSNGLEVLAFVKTRAGLEYPDIQYHFLNLLYEDHGRKIIQREGFMASANVSRPQSRGNVVIASSDPLQAPLIDPRYFSDPEDMRTARASLRIARELIAQPAFDEFRGVEYAPGTNVQSDADLDDYIRSTANSIYHPVGTCRIGTDPMAVVDPQLRVHGIDNLRIVDASVMPTIVSGNTNAAVMMIAEKASDIIVRKAMGRAIAA
ncbi:choline dehydrogenase [Sphingomonas histidinilytica]|uniref:Choline dehydrogenase n=1 Tax=Rhizorhabdus histidinilytica TaxID=439228 RepID=A0A1T5GUI7_9SPHN|nr:choline dehydrogenase [Rhizorhabdus histidinilytica]MBO9380683.1 choline dehydrogenase [Rhizorhabdus histidinilytica]SKC12122.1 choline dehydrogenase [Rhizorhabdus histidinilytica]